MAIPQPNLSTQAEMRNQPKRGGKMRHSDRCKPFIDQRFRHLLTVSISMMIVRAVVLNTAAKFVRAGCDP